VQSNCWRKDLEMPWKVAWGRSLLAVVDIVMVTVDRDGASVS
jgi:hypothetical protein